MKQQFRCLGCGGQVSILERERDWSQTRCIDDVTLTLSGTVEEHWVDMDTTIGSFDDWFSVRCPWSLTDVMTVAPYGEYPPSPTPRPPAPYVPPPPEDWSRGTPVTWTSKDGVEIVGSVHSESGYPTHIIDDTTGAIFDIRNMGSTLRRRT